MAMASQLGGRETSSISAHKWLVRQHPAAMSIHRPPWTILTKPPRLPGLPYTRDTREDDSSLASFAPNITNLSKSTYCHFCLSARSGQASVRIGPITSLAPGILILQLACCVCLKLSETIIYSQVIFWAGPSYTQQGNVEWKLLIVLGVSSHHQSSAVYLLPQLPSIYQALAASANLPSNHISVFPFPSITTTKHITLSARLAPTLLQQVLSCRCTPRSAHSSVITPPAGICANSLLLNPPFRLCLSFLCSASYPKPSFFVLQPLTSSLLYSGRSLSIAIQRNWQ